MIELAQCRKFDVLLFWSLDRLSREGTIKTLEYLQLLTDNEIQYHSYKEPILSSLGPYSEVVIALLATIAKQERLRISERVKAGLERRKALGKPLGRQQGTKLKGTDAKAAHAKRLRAEGKTFGQIGEIMNLSRQRAAQLVAMD